MHPDNTTRGRYEKHERRCGEMQKLDSVHHTNLITCRSRTPYMDVAARGREGDGGAEPRTIVPG
jgi:hypothetical protein